MVQEIVASCFPNKQSCFWKSYFSISQMQKLPKWHLQAWALQFPWPRAQDPRSVPFLSNSPNNSCFSASKQRMTFVLLLQSRSHSSASLFWLPPSVSKEMLRPADRTPHTHPCPPPPLQCLSSSLPVIIVLAQSDPGSSGMLTVT